jgi:DNA-binding transcriptional regulator PaaX
VVSLGMNYFRSNSALKNLLIALVPYTKQNLLLTFKPKTFFYELEKSSGYNRKALNEAMRRGCKSGYIAKEGKDYLEITELGMEIVQPFVASQLEKSKLMVIFDVPEECAAARRQLRRTLQQWGFEQIQKSVWMTDRDHVGSVKRIIDELDLENDVQLYECSLISTR